MSMTDAPLTCALVGLGRMGRGIADRLAGAGRLVGVWDVMPRDGAPAPFLPPVALAGMVDVMLFAVPTTADIRAALQGVTLPEGRVVVDLTTSDPADGAALAAELAAGGVAYVDAAMTGGAQGAAEGRLTLMAGGDVATLARLADTFGLFAQKVFHLGPAGSGQAMKLVHNAILHATYLATCEGLRMAERAGIDAATATAVLNAGNARSFVSEVRFPRDILKPEPSAQSAVVTLAKDLSLAEGFARRLGAPSPYADLTAHLLSLAATTGDPARDFGRLFREYDDFAAREEGA
jgi:3-hydroxyisobutyrate dehydrogenase